MLDSMEWWATRWGGGRLNVEGDKAEVTNDDDMSKSSYTTRRLTEGFSIEIEKFEFFNVAIYERNFNSIKSNHTHLVS